MDVEVGAESRGCDVVGSAIGELSGVGAAEVVIWGTIIRDVAATMGELLASEDTTTSEGVICLTTDVVSTVIGEDVMAKLGELVGATREVTTDVVSTVIGEDAMTKLGELVGATGEVTTDVVSMVIGEDAMTKLGELVGATAMTGVVTTNSDELATVTNELATLTGELAKPTDDELIAELATLSAELATPTDELTTPIVELATPTDELVGAMARGEEEIASDRLTGKLVAMMEDDRTPDSITNVLLGTAAIIGDVVIAAVLITVEFTAPIEVA